MQVPLPTAAKASTPEAGADVKESSLFSGAWNTGDSGLRAHLPLSVETGIYKEGGVVELSTCR